MSADLNYGKADVAAHFVRVQRAYADQFELRNPYGPAVHKVTGLTPQAHDVELGRQLAARMKEAAQ